MPTIAVAPELYQRVEEASLEHEASIGEILTEAVRRYLWELDRRKISEETSIYRQRHAELKAQYLGQYIAMHKGQVVDHDSDFQALHQRIRQQFGRTPVMITLVEDVAERPLVRHGFRMEMPGP
jgi:glutamyl-tRNA reductase